LNLDDAITLETFPNRISAEMAAGLLESEGIETLVLADDAGGAYPMLQYSSRSQAVLGNAITRQAKLGVHCRSQVQLGNEM